MTPRALRGASSMTTASPTMRSELREDAECSSHAKSYRSRRSPEIQIACFFVLPLRAVGVDALSCPGDSTARHFTSTLIVESALSLRMTADYGLLRALAGCGRRCAAQFPQRRTGLPSTHNRSEFRSESSMKASTSFTESEDQCLCGQFKGFEHSERLDECSQRFQR